MGNDYFMIWHRGSSCLTVFDLRKGDFEDLKDFWLHTSKYRRLLPMMAIASQTGTKVIGIGLDEQNLAGMQSMIFYSKGKKVLKDMNQISSYISNVMSIESSLDNNVVFLGGDKNDTAVFGAVSFDEKMAPIKFITVDTSVETVSQIRRVKGTNILAVGYSNKIKVYEYNEKKFKEIAFFEIDGCTTIFEIVIVSNLIYVLDDQGMIFVRFADCRLDTEKSHKQGRLASARIFRG